VIDITEELAAFECIELPANTSVFQQGQACENYILVMEGCVKVFSRTATGRVNCAGQAYSDRQF